MQVPVFANWASFWWQRNCLNLLWKTWDCHAWGQGVLWAVPASPLSNGSSRGSHQASAAEEMVLRSSKHSQIAGTWQTPEETKAKKKQSRKNKTPQPPTLHMHCVFKVPQWIKESTCRQHTRVTLCPSQPSCCFQPLQFLSTPWSPTTHQLKLGPSCCPPQEHGSARVREQIPKAHGPAAAAEDHPQPSCILPHSFSTEQRCLTANRFALQQTTIPSMCSLWNTGRNQKVFSFKCENEVQCFQNAAAQAHMSWQEHDSDNHCYSRCACLSSWA